MLRGRRNSTSGAHVSEWTHTAEVPKYPVLGKDIEVDVCVIGGGITGLSVAYSLAVEGASVAVIEDGAIGSGETGRTTAHLASAVDDRYYALAEQHGEGVARAVAESHGQAIDRIESICGKEGIECGFERLDGYLFASPGHGTEVLFREREAALKAGLEAEIAPRAPIPGFDTGMALRFPRQGQLHPLRYLAGLAEAASRHGAQIYTGGHAVSMVGGSHGQVTLRSGKKVRAGSIVVATNVPVNDRFTMQTKLIPCRSYVLGVKVPADSLPAALLWDTEDPYHYARVVRGKDTGSSWDLLLVGGEDHPTGQAEDFDKRYARLEEWVRGRYPGAGAIHSRWSGQIIETVDGLAYIGRNPGDEANVYIACGDSGNGMTHGTIAGILLTDLIRGRSNPWENAYRPNRLPAKSLGGFGKHNLESASKYVDWLKPRPTEAERSLPAGCGAVVRDGLKPVALYRDQEGHTHRLSAVCPHLKGIVSWNASEQTWDCPLHGSRFDRRGHVINGPANQDLAHLDSAALSEVRPAEESPSIRGQSNRN